MFTTADAKVSPAYVLLDAISTMHTSNLHPEIKPMYYDYGFERLNDTNYFVIGDIQEEMKFHVDVKIDTWPKQNDDVMQRFVNTVKFGVYKDQ
ncbi:hypothetical protein E8E12_010113 [Didymella heteroderae]|uniref:Uncharacterized protein n=1 Tax=Didymella heteroderae TaxID=1769908 RepID=A0A9P4WZ90_9PLEO|nr:hypothetical protein E8E12_010113 [Didymella heteroderae]